MLTRCSCRSTPWEGASRRAMRGDVVIEILRNLRYMSSVRVSPPEADRSIVRGCRLGVAALPKTSVDAEERLLVLLGQLRVSRNRRLGVSWSCLGALLEQAALG